MIRQIFKWLQVQVDVIRPYQVRGYLLFLLLCLSAITEMLTIGSVLPLLAAIIQNSEADNEWFLAWASSFPADTRFLMISSFVLGLFLLRSVIVLAREYYAAHFTNGLRLMWSNKIFENYVNGDLLEIKREKQGHIINSMINEPIYAAKGIRAYIDCLVSGLVILTVGLFLLWLNLSVTVIALFFVMLTIGLLWRISKNYSDHVGKTRVNYNQKINHLIAESVSGIKQIKVFSAELRVRKELNHYIKDLMRMMTQFTIFNAAPHVVGEFIVIFLIITSLCVGHYIFDRDLALLLPEMAVFALALMKLFSMGSLLLSKRMEVATYWPSVKLVLGLASKKSNKRDNCDAFNMPLPEFNKLIFQNISFSFLDGPLVLSNLSLKLEKGQIVGLVGKSGAGKSTFCDILTKLIPPSKGEIYIDEQNLSLISHSAWRQRLGYVSQEPFLFNASVRDNIKIGVPNATDEEVVHAARLAQADAFIKSLPNGYDTLVGIGGMGLSGGQKQRIALAQAFLRKPNVLILDEATSGLDAETEARIFDALHSDFQSSLVILVTHRLSSLKQADVIFFLEGGAIVESGSFKDLYQHDGSFRSLIDQGFETHSS